MTDPLLQRFTEAIMSEQNIVAGVGLDIACGSGENLIYLASQSWDMTGIDRSAESLQKANESADLVGVKIATFEADMETDVNPFNDFAEQSFDLVIVSRYLHRPLFPAIKALIKPGGILIYQTFMVGCELSEIGRPSNPDFLLKPGELANSFAGAELLINEETTTEDGRPFAMFIARLENAGGIH